MGLFQISLVLLCFTRWTTAAQQCAPLRQTPLEGCTVAGYNTTYPFPKDLELSDRSRAWIRQYVSSATTGMENCSVAKMGETIYCLQVAPYCREQDSGPFLPCRRVCSEYLKRCEGTVNRFWLEFLIASCSLLPNLTADSGKCYEPPGFYRYHNASTKGLLEGGCHQMLFPICKGIGFDHTILSQGSQLMLYKAFYGRNFTNSSADAPSSRDSYIRQIEYFFGNHSKCSLHLRKLFCSDLLPACFPEEGFAFYTVCKPLCDQIIEQCPEILQSRYGQYVSDCQMRSAAGNASHGLCKLTKWPTPMRWLRWFEDRPKPQPTSKPPGVKVDVVVIAVIVPIVVVAVIIGSILIWRQRKLPTFFMVRGSDDREELVT